VLCTHAFRVLHGVMGVGGGCWWWQRYKLLLEELLRHTDTAHADYHGLVKALEHIKRLAHHLNEEVRASDNRRVMVALKEELSGSGELWAPHRIFVRKGQLMKVGGDKQTAYQYYLFNDMLVGATKIGWKYKVNHTVVLDAHTHIETGVDRPNYKAFPFSLVRSTATTPLPLPPPPSSPTSASSSSSSSSSASSTSSAAARHVLLTVYAADLYEKNSWLIDLQKLVAAARAAALAVAAGTAISSSSSGGGSGNSSSSSSAEAVGRVASVSIAGTNSSTNSAGAAVVWQPNELAVRCARCLRKFGLLRRKHHCRQCGRVVCAGTPPATRLLLLLLLGRGVRWVVAGIGGSV
jgi:FYVE/RhoGEF/PH domain-containing protein 5/6